MTLHVCHHALARHDALQCFTCQNQSEVKLFRFPRAACSRGCSAFATTKRKLSGYITLRLTDKGLDLERGKIDVGISDLKSQCVSCTARLPVSSHI